MLRLLFAPFTGLAWIAEQIQEWADIERLLALQLTFDMGNVPEEEFEI